MPIYEYKCEETGKIFEVNQSINAEPLANCQAENCECGGKSKTHRIISKNIGVIFNGSGFYETDYVRKKTAETNEPKVNSACNNCPKMEACQTN
jgi:putative FmdB family regulatory protein